MIPPFSTGIRLKGRYLIAKLLASGGMGHVYLAFDEGEEMNVAVKQTFFLDAELRKAFDREAKLLEHLNHPNIPKVTDRFEVEGYLFLVMSFITGKDLSQLLIDKFAVDGRPFPVDRVLQWADSLLQTLDFLHRQSPPVIHRDIKPANLKETRTGQLMVLDFGLAKGHVTQSSQPASVSANSPGFSSPEQTQNQGTDARSDLYSVAATMYQLLSGTIPPAAFMRGLAVMTQQPDPLQPLSKVAPHVPEHISSVIMAGLALYPSNRPQSAQDMRRLLGLAVSTDPYIGKVIMGCRVERQLGAGGMGAVYLGIHEVLQVQRAIKLILPDPPPDAASIERFRVEAQSAAKIHHPNVMQVFDFGKTDDNTFVMVMELLNGEELGDLLKREGTLSPERAVEIAFQIGQGLQAAHNSGIIHRDLKPPNVMVLADGGVKVVDFGIAKVLDGSKGLTGEGFIIGTQMYMSPEQLSGKKLDPRSDQYTLALLLYLMISGRLPFEGGTPRDLILARLGQTPIPLRSTKPDANITPLLDAVILRALSFAPEDRFASVQDFVNQARDAIRVSTDSSMVRQSVAPSVSVPVAQSETVGESKAVESIKTAAGIEMVSIPAGEFQMGGDKYAFEKPVHRVVISEPFYMGKYEVTQAQWESVMGNNPSYFKGQDLPVEQVSWNDCQEFIRKLNAQGDGYIYRLPTEAEWEYACRAGTTGDYAGNLDAMGWYKDNSGSKTHPVGQKQANSWGLYDMHGNVWEWCQDWEGAYPSKSVTDPTGPSSGSARVLRGGSWYDTAAACRSAYRFNYWPGDRYYSLGFRLVRIPK